MTPQERQLVADLFDRLATLENAPRDRDAERAIADGLARAPHAAYPLVQTVLLQDEALKRADARIRELEAQSGMPPQSALGGFLDAMRDSMFGRRENARGSVPSVRSADTVWGTPSGTRNEAAQPVGAYPPERGAAGGSFLGTAAATAAGVIGGAMLLNGIRSMFGHGHGPFGAMDQANAAVGPSPWGDSAGGSDLARDAGLNDIGRMSGDDRTGAGAQGLFGNPDDHPDNADQDPDQDQDDFTADDGFDPGGDE